MRRLVLGLGAAALVVALVGIRVADAPSARAAVSIREHREASVVHRPVRGGPLPTRVALFGDSLAYQSRLAFIAQLTLRAPGEITAKTFPATALCDYRSAILEELLRERPQVLVLEFSGNSGTECMLDGAGAFLEIGSDGWRDRYLADLRDVLTVAGVTGTSVVWATAPPVHHPPALENYPRLLAAAMRRLARTDARLHVVATGKALTTDGRTFAPTLPCQPDEAAICHDGRVDARAVDGLHFDCHGTPDPLGGCIGYSAGGRRFGEAMADAVIATSQRVAR
jgi:hypothetical protein